MNNDSINNIPVYYRLRWIVCGNRPFSDEAFDGREPREVIELMRRAKRWLESRGYSITLKGTYTQVKEVKF